MIRKATLTYLFVLSCSGVFGGCGMFGPTVNKTMRVEFKPYDAKEFRQEREGVIVEYKEIKELPPALIATVQACSKDTFLPLVDSKNNPIMEQIALASPGQVWDQVVLTNNTDHVLRLNQVIIRRFDPAGNEFEPLSKNDLLGMLLTNRPCMSTQKAVPQFKLVKMLDRNTEVLPKTSVTGWIAFQPAATDLPGTWKLAIYEVPVQTDEAGKVIKTTSFEIRSIAKKFQETYTGGKLTDRTEITH